VSSVTNGEADGVVTAIDDMDVYRAMIAQQIATRHAAGIASQGENPDTLPFVIDLNGPDRFHRLADLLRCRGYSDDRVDKILGLNFLRYGREVWGA
jgi:membrane dipeptidase